MGATVNGATLNSYAVLAAGAVLQPGQTVPSNQVWAGNPAEYLRDLSAEEREILSEHREEMC